MSRAVFCRQAEEDVKSLRDDDGDGRSAREMGTRLEAGG